MGPPEFSFGAAKCKPASEPKCFQNQRFCKIKWYVLEGPPESGFGVSKWRNESRSLNVFKNNVSVKDNGLFWKARQNLVLEPQNK
jgi:hypothetical protein